MSNYSNPLKMQDLRKLLVEKRDRGDLRQVLHNKKQQSRSQDLRALLNQNSADLRTLLINRKTNMERHSKSQ